jgi:hypothetical protein
LLSKKLCLFLRLALCIPLFFFLSEFSHKMRFVPNKKYKKKEAKHSHNFDVRNQLI